MFLRCNARARWRWCGAKPIRGNGRCFNGFTWACSPGVWLSWRIKADGCSGGIERGRPGVLSGKKSRQEDEKENAGEAPTGALLSQIEFLDFLVVAAPLIEILHDFARNVAAHLRQVDVHVYPRRRGAAAQPCSSASILILVPAPASLTAMKRLWRSAWKADVPAIAPADPTGNGRRCFENNPARTGRCRLPGGRTCDAELRHKGLTPSNIGS